MNDRVIAHESAHVTIANDVGVATKALYFSDDGAAADCYFKDDDWSKASPRARLRVALAGPVGAALHDDRDWRYFKTMATLLTESRSTDARLVRRALKDAGFDGTKADAVEFLAAVIEDVADDLRGRLALAWAETTARVEAGEFWPKVPGGHAFQDGRMVYWGPSRKRRPEPPYIEDVPDLFAAEPEPEPAPRMRRIVRDLAGRISGVTDE